MRQVRKGQPPEDVSRRGQETQSWQQAERAMLAKLPNIKEIERSEFVRDQFDDLEKGKVRPILRREQRGLCIYCERRVEGHQSDARIEHWQPSSLEPRLALHWRNLYLSCATDNCCDSRKKNHRLRAHEDTVDLPWPADQAYEHCLGYNRMGEVYVREDAPLTDKQRQALSQAIGQPHDQTTQDSGGILNLNSPTLVAARKAAINAERKRLERKFKNRTATCQHRNKLANDLLNEPEYKEFISARVCWLENKMIKSPSREGIEH